MRRIELATQARHALFLSPVAALALMDRGVTELGVAVVTAVLPSVPEVEHVRVSAGDRRLLLELRVCCRRCGIALADVRRRPHDRRASGGIPAGTAVMQLPITRTVEGDVPATVRTSATNR